MRRFYINSLLAIFLTAAVVLFFVLQNTAHAQYTQMPLKLPSTMESKPPSNEFLEKITSPFASCKDMITYEGEDENKSKTPLFLSLWQRLLTKKEPNALWNRLIMDNCANQYIIQRSAVTAVFEPEGAMMGIDQSFCQQIYIPNDPMLSTKFLIDYQPAQYLQRTWARLIDRSSIGVAGYFFKDSNNSDKARRFDRGIIVKNPVCLPGAKIEVQKDKDGNEVNVCKGAGEGSLNAGGGGSGGPSGEGGGGVPWCPDWSKIEGWESGDNSFKMSGIISAAADKYGVPFQLMKAVMALETCGNNEISEAGALGPMQVMPFWSTSVTGGGPETIGLDHPDNNMMAGAFVLLDGAKTCGAKRPELNPWEAAVRCYYGGEGALWNDDANDAGTGGSGIPVTQYWEWVKEDWMEMGGEGYDSKPGEGGGSSSAVAGHFPPVKMTDYITYNDPSSPYYDDYSYPNETPVTANPERILDANHPFSPRDDVVTTDRKMDATCDRLPVDILGFRTKEFGKCVGNRKRFNDNEITRYQNCQLQVAFIQGHPELGMFPPYCEPPHHCTLSINEPDDPICESNFGVFGSSGEQKEGECCYIATKPVMPLNILKIRSAAEAWPCAGQQNCVSAGGGQSYKAPEGYTFQEYFKHDGERRARRPFMRWWDTLVENGQTYKYHLNLSTETGANDAIVGVGREAQNCGYGGGGGKDVKDGNDVVVEVPMPGEYKEDQNLERYAYYGSSWMELKLYQVRARRDFHLNCLAKYEKLFKVGGSENYALQRAGGEWAKNIPIVRNVAEMFPLSWRGYVTETNPTYRFPYLFSDYSKSLVKVGMNNAQAGDILIWDKDVLGENTKRLPSVGYVVHTTADPNNKSRIPWVKVAVGNSGKFPDACGNTDMWGITPLRTMYADPLVEMPSDVCAKFVALYPLGGPPNKNPCVALKNNKKALAAASCDDPMLASCIETPELWNRIKIYRPTDDVRKGGGKKP